MERPLHIGSMHVRLWDGAYIFEDLTIEGLAPDRTPFFTAKRIVVSMPWSTLFNRRIVFDTIELNDWQMHVESLRNGTVSFPKLMPKGPRGKSAWTTTLQYVHAGRGMFTYQDHSTPWGIVARNLDVTVARPGNEYVGQARFSDGLTAIQGYVPFRTDMTSTFKIENGRVLFDRMNLKTEGTESVLNGDVNLSYWPELMLQMKSTIDLPRMRELFFAGETFRLSGKSQFTGTFHLFKEPMPNGTTRTGRELKGTFVSTTAGVNDFRFSDLTGGVRWTPEVLRVTEATTKMYGGQARFSYSMTPLNAPGVTPTARFDAAYDKVDLTRFTDIAEAGRDQAGRPSLRSEPARMAVAPLLQSHRQGRTARHAARGRHAHDPRDAARTNPRGRAARSAGRAFQPVDAVSSPVPTGGDFFYTVRTGLGRDRAESMGDASRRSSSSRGRRRMAAHRRSRSTSRVPTGRRAIVCSPDCSPRSASATRAIPIGGYGTFDGVMTEQLQASAHRRRRLPASRCARSTSSGASTKGRAVIRTVTSTSTDVVITSGESRSDRRAVLARLSRVATAAKRSTRASKSSNGRLRISGMRSSSTTTTSTACCPASSTSTASTSRRYGFGTMAIADGVAYGEPFESATAALRLEGDGVRLDNIAARQGRRSRHRRRVSSAGTAPTRSTSTRSAIPVEIARSGEELAACRSSGLLDFTAGGSGTFDAPRYDVRGTMRDLFVADEGIGQMRRRHQHQQRADDAEAGGGVASSRGLGRPAGLRSRPRWTRS